MFSKDDESSEEILNRASQIVAKLGPVSCSILVVGPDGAGKEAILDELDRCEYLDFRVEGDVGDFTASGMVQMARWNHPCGVALPVEIPEDAWSWISRSSSITRQEAESLFPLVLIVHPHCRVVYVVDRRADPKGPQTRFYEIRPDPAH